MKQNGQSFSDAFRYAIQPSTEGPKRSPFAQTAPYILIASGLSAFNRAAEQF
jgi:hypothetical protein